MNKNQTMQQYFQLLKETGEMHSVMEAVFECNAVGWLAGLKRRIEENPSEYNISSARVDKVLRKASEVLGHDYIEETSAP